MLNIFVVGVLDLAVELIRRLPCGVYVVTMFPVHDYHAFRAWEPRVVVSAQLSTIPVFPLYRILPLPRFPCLFKARC